MRVLEILGNNVESISDLLSAASISDKETADTMREVFAETGYTLDPHGAVAYRALEDKLNAVGGRGILLETAHPAKFDSVANILGLAPEQPPSIKELFNKERSSVTINNDYAEVREIISSKV